MSYLKNFLKSILIGIALYLTSPAWIWVLVVTFKILGSLVSAMLAGGLVLIAVIAMVCALRPAARSSKPAPLATNEDFN
jgi:ABC-type transport system involved in cytochrome c biogenesis permease component